VFIKIEDIGPEGLTLDEPLPVRELAGWLGEDSVYRAVAPGTASVSANWVGPNILVRGSVSAMLGSECSRCLRDTSQRFEVPFTVLFTERIPHAATEEEKDGGDEAATREAEEGEQQFFGGPIIELDEVLRDNLVLNLPMAPRCSDDCKGLCPSCGRDLNEGRCGCAGVETPLAAALKVKIPTGTATVLKKGERSGTPKTKKVPRPSR